MYFGWDILLVFLTILISYAVYYDWDTLLISFAVHNNWDTLFVFFAVHSNWDTLLVFFEVHSNWDTLLVFFAVHSNWDILLNLNKVSLLCKIDYMHVLNEFDSIDMNHPIVRFTTKILCRSVHE